MSKITEIDNLDIGVVEQFFFLSNVLYVWTTLYGYRLLWP